MPTNYPIALILTLFAGLSTVLGGCLTFIIEKDDMRALSVGLGFSAGVMIFLSFTEILRDAQNLLAGFFPHSAAWLVYAGFAFGILVAVLIDYFMPDHFDEGELFEGEEEDDKKSKKHRIKRAGIMTAVAISIHNFPEGMATFFVSAQSLTLGIPVALAIALHNIPEGIAVALPIYQATGKKRKAVWYSFMSGISEPIGAIIGLGLFYLFMPQAMVGFLFAAVAGIMIYISFDTLLPLAKEYGDWHLSIVGIIGGILFIWPTLILLK